MIIRIRVSIFHLLFFSLCTKIVLAKSKCIKKEREALLDFKKGVEDPYHRLSSWNNEKEEDCCKWKGIRCNNLTGHVVKLALSEWSDSRFLDDARLRGNISSSLRELQELSYLDLSYSDFQTIPKFIGSLINLEHLNLCDSFPSFVVVVPNELGNLTKLRYLDLGGNRYTKIENIEVFSNLRFLKYLDLSYMNLSGLTNWADGVDMLPSLKELYLGLSSLPNVTTINSNRPTNSSKSLSVVDLSANCLSFSVYPWLMKYKSLYKLDLSQNCFGSSVPDFTQTFVSLRELTFDDSQLSGTFPESFGQISPLIFLDLSYNNLGGPLPNLDVFPFLKTLRLVENRINGVLPESIGQLLELEVLEVSSNLLEGKISEVHLSNLSKLYILDLSYNSLSLEMSAGWVPSFQLDTLTLSSCNLGPSFPNWLHNQKKLSLIDISSTEISDIVPNWFWDLSSGLRSLNLSLNQIQGTIPDFISQSKFPPIVDLSSNRFSGTIPILPPNVVLWDLSNNMFSGSLNLFLCHITTTNLYMLDLADNLLSEEIPDCFKNLRSLQYLNLANNQFSGKLPHSIGFLDSLNMLNIRNNSIMGELPLSLRYCMNLRLLDLGDNKLSGEIPYWLGESLSRSLVISFWSNKFYGTLPSTLCNLQDVQVLDFSTNNISGTIPNCISNFTAMADREERDPSLYLLHSISQNFDFFTQGAYFNALLEWKGMQSKYKNTLGLVKIIDLSDNKLTGEIPDAITSLAGLVALNLSRNYLTGPIFPNIGKLRWLDFLDLSNNNLSGNIPTGITQLSNLVVLDLSNNNLSGRIPRSTQLQSFSSSTYTGNLDLCGPPLAISCNNDKEPQGPTVNEADNFDDKFITIGFYVSIVLGFAFGFWGFVGTLFFNKNWSYAYFQRLNAVIDRVYVAITLKTARLLRRV